MREASLARLLDSVMVFCGAVHTTMERKRMVSVDGKASSLVDIICSEESMLIS